MQLCDAQHTQCMQLSDAQHTHVCNCVTLNTHNACNCVTLNTHSIELHTEMGTFSTRVPFSQGGLLVALSTHKVPICYRLPSPPSEPELQAHCMLHPVRIRIPPIPMFSVLVLVASITQTALLAPLARTQWDGDNRALSVPFSPTLLTPICGPCNS